MRLLLVLLVAACGAGGSGQRAIDADLGSPPDASAGDAARADAAPPAPIRVAVISDLNGSYGSTSYNNAVSAGVARIIELAPDLVLSTGDMVAGQQAGLDYEAMWTAFHGAVSDPLAAAGIPLAVTPGNHDASGYSAFAGERAIFVAQWSARRPEVSFLDDSDYPLRYSFAVGPALFLSLDDTTVGALDSDQMTWLADQLTTHAAYPVKIVYGHLPLYPFAQGRETEVIGDPALESLLVDHGVDLFVSGHHHAYYPGARGPLRLVSMACLGAGPRKLIGTDLTSPRSLLLIDIDSTGITRVDAYGGADFAAPISRSALPEAVGAGSGRIDRDDL